MKKIFKYNLEISLIGFVFACWFLVFATAKTRADVTVIGRSDIERIVRALETIAQNSSKCK